MKEDGELERERERVTSKRANLLQQQRQQT